MAKGGIALTHRIEIRIDKDYNYKRNWAIFRDTQYIVYKLYNEFYSYFYEFQMLQRMLYGDRALTEEEMAICIGKFFTIYGDVEKKKAIGRPPNPDTKIHSSGYADPISAKIGSILKDKYCKQTVDACKYCDSHRYIKEKDKKVSSCSSFVLPGKKNTTIDNRGDCKEYGTTIEMQIISPTIVDRIKSEVQATLKDDWFKQGLNRGNRSVRNYKLGIPMPANVQDITKFKYDDTIKEYSFSWQGIKFITVNSYKDNNNCVYLDSVVNNGIYKFADSSIQIKEGKIYLLLCTTQEKTSMKLDEDIVVGVDLGINIPAMCGINNIDNVKLALGSRQDFLRVRTRIQNQKRNTQKHLVLTSGGHGRKKKLQALDRFTEKERNFVKTYNHMISSKIVDFCVKNNAGTLNLELLEGFSEKQRNNFILRNWSYYELQSMIEYKAKIAGIVVNYIDPYHTSQSCSKCGHYEEGQRGKIVEGEFISKLHGGDIFLCKECGTKLNSDFNAARNIAKSTKRVDKKEDCEYYRLTHKEDV